MIIIMGETGSPLRGKKGEREFIKMGCWCHNVAKIMAKKLLMAK